MYIKYIYVSLLSQEDIYFSIYIKFIYIYRLFCKVSATFAASLVTSPAIGAYLGRVYSDNLVIALATAVAILDVIFIIVAVPESLPEKCRVSNWGSMIAWEKADPFGVSNSAQRD